MPNTTRMSPQVRGRIGGLTRSALASTPQATTQAARDGRWAKYKQHVLEVLPELADDPAELDRRAALLRRADMVKMSALAAAKRRELAELEAALDATGLDDAGSDGVDRE